MGFGDFLKKAQDVGTGVVNSAVQKGKQISNGQKSAAEDAGKLEGIEDYGFIKGEGIEKPSDNALISVGESFIKYGLDLGKSRLVIFEQKYGMFKSKRTFIAEYPFSDIAEIKNNEVEISDYGTFKQTSYYNTLVLSSGKTLEIYNSIKADKNPTVLSIEKEMTDWKHVSNLIFTFIFDVEDDKTKAWINEFYLSSGGTAAFDESGEIDCEAYFNMDDELRNKKIAEWKKQIETIT